MIQSIQAQALPNRFNARPLLQGGKATGKAQAPHTTQKLSVTALPLSLAHHPFATEALKARFMPVRFGEMSSQQAAGLVQNHTQGAATAIRRIQLGQLENALGSFSSQLPIEEAHPTHLLGMSELAFYTQFVLPPVSHAIPREKLLALLLPDVRQIDPTMRLSDEEKKLYLAGAEAVLSAGLAAQTAYEKGEHVGIISKEGHNDLVTKGDFAADRALATVLSQHAAVASPSKIFKLLSEDRSEGELNGIERVAVNKTSDDPYNLENTWVADPADGTAYYINGSPYASLLSYFDVNPNPQDTQTHGLPQMAFLLEMPTGKLYSAIRGKGAWVNGKRVQVKDVLFQKRSLKEGIVNIQFPKADFKLDAQSLMKSVKALLVGGAIDGAKIALGLQDGIAQRKTYPWDFAGMSLFLHEAGVPVTDIDGNWIDFKQPRISVVAAQNETLHQELLEAYNAAVSPIHPNALSFIRSLINRVKKGLGGTDHRA